MKLSIDKAFLPLSLKRLGERLLLDTKVGGGCFEHLQECHG